MRERVYAAVLLLMLAGSAVLTANEARYDAMGGAFTAIGDDENTIISNPAGLAFITENTLKSSSDIFIDTSASFVNYELPDVSELGDILPYDLRYDWENEQVAYYDYDTYEYSSSMDSGTTYDEVLAGLGFDTDGLSGISEDEYYDMLSWYDAVTILDFLSSEMISTGVSADISLIDRNFGFMYERTISAGGSEDHQSIEMNQEHLYAGAFARRLGGAALGINAIYTSSSTVSVTAPDFSEYGTFCDDTLAGFGAADPDELGLLIMNGKLFDHGVTERNFEVGLGAMVTTGAITLGASIPDLKVIFDDFENILVDMNIGAAYESNRRKIDGSENFLNLLAAADIHQLGDDENRTLHAGTEIGLSIAELITADVRTGYQQPLTGSFADILDEGILRTGESTFSMGFGLKALIFAFDVSLQVPTLFLQEAVRAGGMEDSTAEDFFDSFDDDEGPSLTITSSLVF